ncbi:MAG: UDP-4-amino-4,6-dideoxy-N-acetyl-beta-L-altrosamine transaminase [Alphaproteobacteria bacterium]|nr:UDP-4-amino-4,6-dideoxy-N-acetyl-beta-L-altrosamine transaminase [Alphaproteobacteria bacterium]
MSNSFLPYGRHQIDDDDIEAVVDVLKNGALTCGPKVDAFEQAFAEKIGAKHAVVCSNGTTALHLAVLVAGVAGKVVVPSVTFLSTANVVRMAGADVVFADVCPATGLMTAASLKAALAKSDGNVSAVMPVHLNGQCAEMKEIAAIAKAAGAAVITDCCHALGAEYTGETGGRPGDGQYEDIGCFSLHPVKSIAMGEGGVVTTNNDTFARELRLLRGHGMVREPEEWADSAAGFDADNGDANPWYYEMQALGYNYRATDMQCALGLSQLRKLDRFIARRREIAGLYDKLLGTHSNMVVPIERTNLASSAWHLYPVLIDFARVGKSRAAVMKALAEIGVGTQVHYIPVSDQPYYRNLYGKQDLPGASDYYGKVLSLPIFPAMSDEDVHKVVDALVKVLR